MAVYARPLDPEHSVVCMDEQPIELLKELRRVITGTRIHAKRVDYEYERAGTASIFMFCEALAGWRQVSESFAAWRPGTGAATREKTG